MSHINYMVKKANIPPLGRIRLDEEKKARTKMEKLNQIAYQAQTFMMIE